MNKTTSYKVNRRITNFKKNTNNWNFYIYGFKGFYEGKNYKNNHV